MANKKPQFNPEDTVRIKTEILNCNKRRGQVVGRTGFPEQFLKDGTIRVLNVFDNGHIQIKHPQITRKPVIHAKFFELATSAA